MFSINLGCIKKIPSPSRRPQSPFAKGGRFGMPGLIEKLQKAQQYQNEPKENTNQGRKYGNEKSIVHHFGSVAR